MTTSTSKFYLYLALHFIITVSAGATEILIKSMLPIKGFNRHNHTRDIVQVSTQNHYSSRPHTHSNLKCFTKNISTCPPWQYCNYSDTCRCGDSPYDAIICGENITISVLNCFCVTSDQNNSRSELGMCLFNCQHARHGSENRIYRSFPSSVPKMNNALCGKFNRQGSLCGSCKDGYYPLAYSYNLTCVRCEDVWYNWIEYFIIVYVPLTFFYFIILFFQVNTTSSYLLGFILYTQAISFPMMSRILVLSYHNNTYYKIGIEIAASLYGIWNLEFFRILNHSTCLRSNFLVITTLDLVSGIYPLLLILITYAAVSLYDANLKPLRTVIQPLNSLFRKYGEKLDIRTSLIDAFSTFFLLSSMKIFNVLYDLLAPTKTYTLNSTGQLSIEYRLYLSGDIGYFGNSHLPFATLAIAVLFFCIVIPILCFSIYPFSFIQTCFLAHLPNRWQVILHTFVDTYHGSFKNGTERGSRDYRWFSGILLTARFQLSLLYAFTFDIMYFILASMMLALLATAIVVLQPFADRTMHNKLTPSFILYLSCVYISLIGGDISTIRAPQYVPLFQLIGFLMGFTPILYAACLFIYWVVKRTNWCQIITIRRNRKREDFIKC